MALHQLKWRLRPDGKSDKLLLLMGFQLHPSVWDDHLAPAICAGAFLCVPRTASGF